MKSEKPKVDFQLFAAMGKHSKRSSRRQRYNDMVNGEGIFETPDCDDLLRISFAYILFAQMYWMLMYYVLWIFDCEKGNNGKEMKRDRKPFEIKVGS